MASVNTGRSVESRPIRWGILGTGDIARKFAHALTFVPDAELMAVGSRAAASAAAFASEFNIPDAHVSYAALANDPAVDVVYIATPHKLHYENCMLCLDAGKAVLCEKSLTMNAAQTERIIRTAREKRLFLMEAMWTRYIPLIVRLRQLLAEGAIGRVQLFTGALGFTDPLPPTHYMFNLDLGGGILLDAGIYPVSMASMVFGRQPSRIATLAEFDKGVDVQDVIDFGYDGGQQAAIAISLKTIIPPEFSVYGDAGRLRIHPPMWNPTRMTLVRDGQDDELIEIPFVGTGWNYQVVEVGRCLREGELESASMPLDESLAIMQTMDKIRAERALSIPLSESAMTEAYTLDQVARLPAPGDNVAIVTRRLEAGTRIRLDSGEVTLDTTVLEGHRIAMEPLAPGEALLSWGFPFGFATRPISAGEYVINTSTLESLRERTLDFELPLEANFRNHLEAYHFNPATFHPAAQVPLYPDPRTFLGYRRVGRGVGTRNMIVVLGVTSSAASYARVLALRAHPFSKSYPNIDGVAAVAHTEGSGHDALNNRELLLRTLAGLIVNPNVGAALIVDYGTDQITGAELRAYMIEHDYPLADVPHAFLTLRGDFEADLQRGLQIIEPWLSEVNQTARTPESLAELKIALQCGGSDAFSGISGNPLAAAVAKEVVRYGGAANLAETDELVGAEEYVLDKVRDEATARAFLNTVSRFKAYLGWHGLSAEGNPSGGNRFRGLYNIALKSLGAAMKKDPALRLDYVIDYAAAMTQPGFYFMDSPGNDLESVAGQIAAGCNMIFFVTGNGSITNFPFVPTIKIVTTTGRYELMPNEMDVNAGTYLEGEPLADLTRETLDLTVRIASGELCKGERAQHSQISIWRNWRQQEGSQINVILESPPPDGAPIPIRVGDDRLDDRVTFPVWREDGRTASEFVGMILPTSLCAGQVGLQVAERLTLEQRGHEWGIERFVALAHTEGCGMGGETAIALYQRTMLDYITHPMVRAGLFLEHGCEITHNDFMQRRLKELGGDGNDFGWASIQLDGGIERVTAKIEQWFARKLDSAPLPTRERVGLDHLKLGILALEAAPAPVAAQLARLTRTIVAAGGIVIIPSSAPLLETPSFARDTMVEPTLQPSLAYGQAARRKGFHIMEAPSTHWVETLTGLGATGVEVVLAYPGDAPRQAHPFIPVIQFSDGANVTAPGDFDLVLEDEPEQWGAQMLNAVIETLAGKRGRTFALGNADFQITRGLLGVTM